jgi:16S rRNA (adenine1518-N6/adenine1519-N6)-dimethyltransferase
MVQTQREIKSLLAEVGLHPQKRFGQNFLVDGNLLRKIVQAADVQPTDVVLEVGPGTGSLTEELLSRAGHVVAVEIDRGLQALCFQRFADQPHFTLIGQDVLERKSELAPLVLETLAQRHRQLGGRLLLVANLPYQVATPLIIDLLLCDLPFAGMYFTVQAEVADRFTARPGTRDYGPVSIFCQQLADVSRIARVPATAFWPPPKIASAMLALQVCRARYPESATLARWVALVRCGFSHRRKTLHWNLRTMLSAEQLARLENDPNWDLSLRAEALPPARWLELAELLV